MRIQTLFRAALIAFGLFAISASADAHWDIGVSVGFAPPPLPVYEQPACPGNGYLWTPGYWAYDAEQEGDYYWVPGTWVLAPRPGYLWTPGYWGAEGAAGAYFAWHSGYWGLHVGFYGGIDYGFGYFGSGYEGGYWRDNDFFYNRAVTNVTNVSITNVYNNTVVNNGSTEPRVSYNGGPQGARLRPSGAEFAAARAAHIGATTEQRRHETAARSIPDLHAAVNHGIPSVAATATPAVFTGPGLAMARGGRGIPAGTARASGDARPASNPRSEVATRPYSGAGTIGRSEASPSSQAVGRPRADRPAWADRTAPPVGSGRATVAPVQPPRDAHQTRSAPPVQYRPSAPSAYAVPSRQQTPMASRQDVRASAPFTERGYPRPTQSAPVPRYSPPGRSAPSYQNAAREPARRSYSPPAATATREGIRAPSYPSPQRAAAPSAPQPSNRAPDGRARDPRQSTRGRAGA